MRRNIVEPLLSKFCIVSDIPDTAGVKSGKTALAPRRLLFKPKPEFEDENPIPAALEEVGSEKRPLGDSGLP